MKHLICVNPDGELEILVETSKRWFRVVTYFYHDKSLRGWITIYHTFDGSLEESGREILGEL